MGDHAKLIVASHKPKTEVVEVVVGGCVGTPVGIGWSSMQVSVLQRDELLQMQ